MEGVTLMRYFQNSGQVYGYDLTQTHLINQAIASGWTEVTGAWPQAPQPQYKTQFSSLEYLDKFTESEQLAVVTATLANAQVKLWYDKMLAASFVDIADLRTSAGLDALIAAGLLAPARKAQILEPQVIA